jgi:hypothetical protein
MWAEGASKPYTSKTLHDVPTWARRIEDQAHTQTHQTRVRTGTHTACRHERHKQHTRQTRIHHMETTYDILSHFSVGAGEQGGPGQPCRPPCCTTWGLHDLVTRGHCSSSSSRHRRCQVRPQGRGTVPAWCIPRYRHTTSQHTGQGLGERNLNEWWSQHAHACPHAGSTWWHMEVGGGLPNSGTCAAQHRALTQGAHTKALTQGAHTKALTQKHSHKALTQSTHTRRSICRTRRRSRLAARTADAIYKQASKKQASNNTRGNATAGGR